MGRVDSLSVNVTGAAADIDRATALCFAPQTARVVVSDIGGDGVAETVTSIEQDDGKAIFVSALMDQAVATYGKIAPFAVQRDANFDTINSVSLKRTDLYLKAEIAAMPNSSSGANANVAFVAGLTKNVAVEGSKSGTRVDTSCPKGTAQEVVEQTVWLCPTRASFVVDAIAPVGGGFVSQ